MKKQLNTTIVYVLSIVSFLCCCFVGLGVFLAGPAFFMANKGLKEAALNPEEYDQKSVNAMKTAKIIAIIALAINGIYLLYNIYVLSTTDWDVLMQRYNDMLEQAGAAQ